MLWNTAPFYTLLEYVKIVVEQRIPEELEIIFLKENIIFNQ